MIDTFERSCLLLQRTSVRGAEELTRRQGDQLGVCRTGGQWPAVYALRLLPECSKEPVTLNESHPS